MYRESVVSTQEQSLPQGADNSCHPAGTSGSSNDESGDDTCVIVDVELSVPGVTIQHLDDIIKEPGS